MFSQSFGGPGFMATKATQAAKAMAGKAVKTAQAARTARAPKTSGASGPADYDAIIVGGGHNGLVAAAYLARSGARTLVLEGRPKTGGAATTEAPWPDAPDFKVTRLSYVMSLLPPTIINDLQLERHGYKIYPMGPYYQAFPEGGSIKLYADDAKRNHDEVSKWSKKDADAMPRWDAWLAGLAEVLGPLLLTVPPNLGSRKPRDLNETLRLAWPLRARHRLRDGAPLHRRRRRRSPGQLGLPRGRHGRGRGRHRQRRPPGRRGDPAQRARPQAPAERRPRLRRRAGERPADHRQGRRDEPAPAHRVPGPRGPGEPARRLRDRHRALEDPQRRRQDQPGAGRTSRLHRRPRHEPAGSSASARLIL